MAVVRAEDESELREIEAADPAVTGGIGRYDLLPLPGAITTADE